MQEAAAAGTRSVGTPPSIPDRLQLSDLPAHATGRSGHRHSAGTGIVTHHRWCHTNYTTCMTMLSFRVAEEEAAEVGRWADRLGIGRSEFLRQSLRRHLVWLASAEDADLWVAQPLSDEESAVAEIADWGVAEDWSDWADAAG